jgi:hypothetical protein
VSQVRLMSAEDQKEGPALLPSLKVWENSIAPF